MASFYTDTLVLLDTLLIFFLEVIYCGLQIYLIQGIFHTQGTLRRDLACSCNTGISIQPA